jgi:hypothetical protein
MSRATSTAASVAVLRVRRLPISNNRSIAESRFAESAALWFCFKVHLRELTPLFYTENPYSHGNRAICCEGNPLAIYDSYLSRHPYATALRQLDVQSPRAALLAAFPLARDRPASRPLSQEPTSDPCPIRRDLAPLLWQCPQ